MFLVVPRDPEISKAQSLSLGNLQPDSQIPQDSVISAEIEMCALVEGNVSTEEQYTMESGETARDLLGRM